MTRLMCLEGFITAAYRLIREICGIDRRKLQYKRYKSIWYIVPPFKRGKDEILVCHIQM